MGLIKIHDVAFHLRVTRIVEQIWHFPLSSHLAPSAQRIGVGVVVQASGDSHYVGDPFHPHSPNWQVTFHDVTSPRSGSFVLFIWGWRKGEEVLISDQGLFDKALS